MAADNVANGGGPFGAVIARQGHIIAEGVNRVTDNHDPTAHAEVMAIREATRRLGTFTLEGCDIYSSCEPCPMCLGAIYWARLDHLYFAADHDDAARAGFDDAHIYRELERPLAERNLPTTPLSCPDASRPFDLWRAKSDRTDY